MGALSLRGPGERPGAHTSLRRRVARGTILNSGFEIGLAGLGALRGVVVAAFLTREEFGIWGIMLTVLITLVWLKDVGVADKYIQQSDSDQELAFQKAFTVELIVSVAYVLVACAVLPLYALAYGHTEIIVPGAILATSVVLMAFETPVWIPYRTMDYGRQRVLGSIDPVVSIVMTIALCAAGLGYWGLVLGAVIGSAVGAVVCTLTSPFRLRLRFDRSTVREYARFSWPLVGVGFTGLLVVQGSLLVANRVLGLAAIGAIGLAVTIAAFANRVDGIVSQTIYPAVCAVADRPERLAEVFVKSNRIALMWAMPFGAGLALFAHDLVHFVLGDRWRPAVGLLVAIGLTSGFGQVAFNWALFLRALNRTRPIFVVALLDMVVFFAVAIPAMLTLGLVGYAVGIAASTVVQIVARGYVMRRLFGGFDVLGQLLRAIAPTVPAAALVLLIRLLIPGDRPPALAAAELVVYALATVAFTLTFERRLVAELAGYLGSGTARPSAPAS